MQVQFGLLLAMGIAGIMGELESLAVLLDKADMAMYVAKKAGRNRIVIENQLVRIPRSLYFEFSSSPTTPLQLSLSMVHRWLIRRTQIAYKPENYLTDNDLIDKYLTDCLSSTS